VKHVGGAITVGRDLAAGYEFGCVILISGCLFLMFWAHEYRRVWLAPCWHGRKACKLSGKVVFLLDDSNWNRKVRQTQLCM